MSHEYVESGLDGIGLENGFETGSTRHGPTISFTDVDGLHRAIASAIAKRNVRLDERAFMFLRKEIGVSIRQLALALGKAPATVAAWERGKAPIDPTADRVLRVLWEEHAGMKGGTWRRLQRLAAMDEFEGRNLRARHDGEQWGVEENKAGGEIVELPVGDGE